MDADCSAPLTAGHAHMVIIDRACARAERFTRSTKWGFTFSTLRLTLHSAKAGVPDRVVCVADAIAPEEATRAAAKAYNAMLMADRDGQSPVGLACAARDRKAPGALIRPWLNRQGEPLDERFRGCWPPKLIAALAAAGVPTTGEPCLVRRGDALWVGLAGEPGQALVAAAQTLRLQLLDPAALAAKKAQPRMMRPQAPPPPPPRSTLVSLGPLDPLLVPAALAERIARAALDQMDGSDTAGTVADFGPAELRQSDGKTYLLWRVGSLNATPKKVALTSGTMRMEMTVDPVEPGTAPADAGRVMQACAQRQPPRPHSRHAPAPAGLMQQVATRPGTAPACAPTSRAMADDTQESAAAAAPRGPSNTAVPRPGPADAQTHADGGWQPVAHGRRGVPRAMRKRQQISQQSPPTCTTNQALASASSAGSAPAPHSTAEGQPSRHRRRMTESPMLPPAPMHCDEHESDAGGPGGSTSTTPISVTAGLTPAVPSGNDAARHKVARAVTGVIPAADPPRTPAPAPAKRVEAQDDSEDADTTLGVLAARGAAAWSIGAQEPARPPQRAAARAAMAKLRSRAAPQGAAPPEDAAAAAATRTPQRVAAQPDGGSGAMHTPNNTRTSPGASGVSPPPRTPASTRRTTRDGYCGAIALASGMRVNNHTSLATAEDVMLAVTGATDATTWTVDHFVAAARTYNIGVVISRRTTDGTRVVTFGTGAPVATLVLDMTMDGTHVTDASKAISWRDAQGAAPYVDVGTVGDGWREHLTLLHDAQARSAATPVDTDTDADMGGATTAVQRSH